MQHDYQQLLDNMFDGLYFVDRQRVITYWNKAAEKITGYLASEVIGRSCKDGILMHIDDKGRSLCKGMRPLAWTIGDGKPREAEIFLHHKEGHRVPVWVRVMPLKDENGAIIGGVELFSDLSNESIISERIRELERRAMLDRLTGLPNRNHLEPEIDGLLHEVKRYNAQFGVLFCDIDNFKSFNDTYGHDLGDTVLKTVARTLKFNTRPFDLFGRWGGEEFVGIIRNVNRDTLYLVGERCRVVVEKTLIPYNNTALNVTVSIGATTGRTVDTVDSVLKRADTLLYESKRNGRNRVTLESDA
jgi:diguanylate cyclase (GGDEF)-like protein/PAS domain S-box-containing protein